MTALASLTGPARHDVDDADLVAGARAGDDRAFDALFRRYQPRIAAFVRSKVHDHGRTEDITQEVFLSALRRLRETDAEIAFKPWIYEIARNACIDAWRRSRHTDEVSFDEHDALGGAAQARLAQPTPTPDSAVDVKLAFDDLRGALGGLSPTQHELLVLREFEGRSYREIGDRLGMSRASVESALFRARRQLTHEHEELVSGKRCRTVQSIIDTHGGRGLGVRTERRMAQHLAHCQPCRRYAWVAGIDVDRFRRPSVAARIAAWLPWPLFWRRRGPGDAGQLAAPAQSAPLANAAQWSSSAMTALDPAAVSGLSKLVATAATVAVASFGAGAAIHEREAIKDFFRGGPAPAAAERSQAADRPDAATPGTYEQGAAAGPLASNPTAGGGPSGDGSLPAGPGGSPASGGQQPAGAARTPLAATPDAAGGDRSSSATTSSPTRPGTAGVTPTTAGDLPSAPSAPSAPSSEPLTSGIAPTADGATGGGGAATAPSAPVSRPQAPSPPSAPSADDVTGQAGSVGSGAPAVPSPSSAGVSPPVAVPTPAPPKVSSSSPTATDTLSTATAGRLAP